MGDHQQMTDVDLQHTLNRGSVGGCLEKIIVAIGGILLSIGFMASMVPLTVIGIILVIIGSAIGRGARHLAHQATYDTIVPEVLLRFFDRIDLYPDQSQMELNPETSDIPLVPHSELDKSGYVQFTYQGLKGELCNVILSDATQFLNDQTEMWEERKYVAYRGQWMVYDLNTTFPTGLTLWPRGKMDKIFRTPTIKMSDEKMNQRLNLSCDHEAWAMTFLDAERMAQLRQLMDTAFAEFSVSLHADGKLYIAVHSGHDFFDIGKGREKPEVLRQRFMDEMKWWTDMMKVFIPAN